MDKRSIIFVLVLTASLFFVQSWFSPSPAPKSPEAHKIAVEQEKDTESLYEQDISSETLPASNEETFYVLENDYQQIVFSNIGGAISEINLPFRSEKNPNSVIREISMDKGVEKYNPANDYFPLFPAYVINSETQSNELNQDRSFGGYYPLLRRSIVGVGRDRSTFHVPPQDYCLNVISQDPETARLVYKVRRFEKNLIEFEASESHRRIIKTFSLPTDPLESPYCFDVSIKIEGDTRGVWLTSGVPEVELISGNASPAIKYSIRKGSKPVIESVDLPKTSTSFSSIQPDWICNSNGFLGIIIDPLTEISSGFSTFHIPGSSIPSRLSLIDPDYHLYPVDKFPGYEIQLPLRSSNNQKMQFRIFAGPFDDEILKRVDLTYTDPVTGYSPNYEASQSFHGWFSFISEPFANFLFILLRFFYQLTHSWGISIILLTVALRIMLYPLNGWSIKSTLSMQKIAPQVTIIQEKYKKEPKRAQMEVMNLYREKGVNPLTGCLPLLIQMPFLIGMFDLLKSSFELRGVRFIPGWIDSLTSPDVVFSWNYPIFFFGTEFHLLPIILGLVMFLQQRYSSSAPKDKSLLTDQQKQQKTMGNVMTIVFAVMFYHFPSGLNIYWLSSMLLGMLQQWWMTRNFQLKQVKGKK